MPRAPVYKAHDAAILRVECTRNPVEGDVFGAPMPDISLQQSSAIVSASIEHGPGPVTAAQ